jgi:hypothetical protein
MGRNGWRIKLGELLGGLRGRWCFGEDFGEVGEVDVAVVIEVGDVWWDGGVAAGVDGG